MKAIQDEHLEFVARHYDNSALSTRKAWRNVRNLVSAPRLNYGYIMAALATAAVILVVLILNSDRYNRTTIAAETVAHTVILPDQTKLTMAPGASLSYDRRRFAHKDRSVIQTGKVYYDVERNETLPFEVHTTDAMVRVLGTSFQIDESAERTSVDVVSGRVFFAASCDIGNGLELTNGMHAEICDGLLLPELSEAVTMNPAAWATHHFVFDDAPIEAVLEDLSSAFGRTIVCDLDEHRLSGDFYADSLEEAVSIIETTLDVKLRVL